MQNINLAVGYHNIPNIHQLNLSLTDDLLKDIEYQIPSPFQGLSGFREAVSAKLQIANGVQHLSEDNILVTQGATQAIWLIVNTLLKEGDKVLLPLPAWGYFKDVLQHCKADIQELSTQFSEQYKPTAKELDAALSADTKMLILTHPGNPGGGVYSYEDLVDIVNVLEQYPDLLILSDEVYELNIYKQEKEFYPLSFFPSVADRVITVNGFSKSFGLTPWRVAYLYSHNRAFIEKLTELQRLNTFGLPVATQRLAWSAQQKERLYTVLWQQFGKPRLQQLFDFFELNPYSEIYLPEGAYFLFPNLSKLCKAAGFKESPELPLFLQENYNLQIADGANFGLPFHYRINCMQTEAIIQETINRLEAAFSDLGVGKL